MTEDESRREFVRGLIAEMVGVDADDVEILGESTWSPDQALASFDQMTEMLLGDIESSLAHVPEFAGMHEAEKIIKLHEWLYETCPDHRLLAMGLAILLMREIDRRKDDRFMKGEP